VQRPSCSTADLVSEEAPASTAPAVFLTVLAADRLYRRHPVKRNAQKGSAPARWKPAPVRRVMVVAGMRSAGKCYRNVCRYSAGVMPVARRNARVKLDCEENRQSKAISPSDARPAAIIALALSSRRWLT
jgi:hypothetical protein